MTVLHRSRTSLITVPESSAKDLGMCLPEWATDKEEEPYFVFGKLKASFAMLVLFKK